MTVKHKTNIHKKDYETTKDYNRARMHVVNRMKARDIQKERWQETVDYILNMELSGMSPTEIVDNLIDTLPYKLAKPNTKKS